MNPWARSSQNSENIFNARPMFTGETTLQGKIPRFFPHIPFRKKTKRKTDGKKAAGLRQSEPQKQEIILKSLFFNLCLFWKRRHFPPPLNAAAVVLLLRGCWRHLRRFSAIGILNNATAAGVLLRKCWTIPQSLLFIKGMLNNAGSRRRFVKGMLNNAGSRRRFVKDIKGLFCENKKTFRRFPSLLRFLPWFPFFSAETAAFRKKALYFKTTASHW